MTKLAFYPIGTVGKKWGEAEIAAWFASCQIKRSYQEDVLTPLYAMQARLNALGLEIVQYGALSINPARYPLLAVKSRISDPLKPTVLVTGGVHGYETSGVHGALAFLANQAAHYVQQINLVVAVCVSPWGYETINRWNPKAIDPNRSFYINSPAEESAALMQLVASIEQGFDVHIDLHETTDSDEQEFRPALAARDGKDFIKGSIPDGFYTVGDTENPQDAFQKAIIDGVSNVTHIAPADEKGEIIGSTVVQHGVINYPLKALGLCSSVTGCIYNTTTEVYPDSPTASAEECNRAQVAAMTSAIDYVLALKVSG
ncbi:M14 family metallopeptidase [Shewanella sp.]|uniref:M14 family metallopeptidase n=1 Tax=Shewanella sp. TaxID=50422 RepID=UPI003F414B59